MRNRRRIWGVAAAALLLGGTLAAPSRAAVITVENGGFEEPNFGADATATSNTIPDWNESAVTPFIPSGGGAYGVTDPAPANNPVPPTEGDQIAYMVLTDSAGGTNARGIWQVTSGQLVAGERYTLSVTIGTQAVPDNRLDAGYVIQLLAAGAGQGAGATTNESQLTVLAEEDNVAPIPQFGSGWITRTITYDVLPGDPLIGRNLAVRIGTSTPPDGLSSIRETTFDAVTLTSGPIPEPASLAVLSLALLGALRRRRSA